MSALLLLLLACGSDPGPTGDTATPTACEDVPPTLQRVADATCSGDAWAYRVLTDGHADTAILEVADAHRAERWELPITATGDADADHAVCWEERSLVLETGESAFGCGPSGLAWRVRLLDAGGQTLDCARWGQAGVLVELACPTWD